MEFYELISGYGLDVVLISLINAAVCALIKRFLLKEKPRAVAVIAYLAGTAMYVLYESILRQDALYLFKNLSSVGEHSLSVGTLTVLLCIVIDRFFGGGSAAGAEGAIEEMLEGLVAEESKKECAEKIAEAAKKMKGDGLKEEVAAIIEACGGNASMLECAMIAEAAERLYGNDGTEIGGAEEGAAVTDGGGKTAALPESGTQTAGA